MDPAIAQQPTEDELADYRAIMMTREPATKLALIDSFLTSWPESIINQTLLREAIPAAAEIDPASSRVLDYARRLIVLEGETPMAYNDAAWELYAAEAHFEQAAEWAGIAIEGFPPEDISPAGKENRALVLDTVAHLTHVLGDTEGAIRLQQEVVVLDPVRRDYPVSLSRFLVDEGRYREAEYHVVEAVLKTPRYVRARSLLEEIASNLAGEEMSADEYMENALAAGVDRLLSESDDAALTRRSLAAALIDLDKLIEIATRLARDAVEDAPDDPTANAIMGDILVKAHEWDEAEPYLMAALLQTPRDRRARMAFELLIQRRMREEIDTDTWEEAVAARGIERMLAGDKDPLEVKRLLSTSLLSLDVQLDRALLFAREVEEMTGPTQGAEAFKTARMTLAELELIQGNYEAVLGALEPITPLVTTFDFGYFITKGKALEQLERPAEAIETYLECVASYPHPAILDTLRARWEEVHGEEKDLDEVLAALREEPEEWHPKSEFEVPGEWSGRVVLAELFTGSECPPCVASDMAYDYLLEYYPDSVLGILEYHLHIPGPDPMTSADSEARMNYYNETDRIIGGTPTSIVNGTDVSVGGGGSSAARTRFNLYSWSIQVGMNAVPELEIDLTGQRDGNSILVDGTVSITGTDLSDNEHLRLRVALAEKMVHHEGGNRIAEHKMVVRKLLGGADGVAIDAGEGRLEFAARVDVAELEAQLLAYLTTWEAENVAMFPGSTGFPVKRYEIDEENLVIVAFVQDDSDRSVLQVQVIDLR